VSRVDAVSSQLLVRAIADAGLFSQGLPANAFLTRFTDANFEVRYLFGAHQTFPFAVFAHRVSRFARQRHLPRDVLPLLNNSDLRRILDYQLQTVLWMLLDFTFNLNFFSFEAFGQNFPVLEEFHRRSEDDAGQSVPGRTKIEKIGVALGRMTDTKDSAANSRSLPD
jgi:hypothetical protein